MGNRTIVCPYCKEKTEIAALLPANDVHVNQAIDCHTCKKMFVVRYWWAFDFATFKVEEYQKGAVAV